MLNIRCDRAGAEASRAMTGLPLACGLLTERDAPLPATPNAAALRARSRPHDGLAAHGGGWRRSAGLGGERVGTQMLDDVVGDDLCGGVAEHALVVEHVEARASERAGIERVAQCGRVDERAACGVDDDRARLAAGESIAIQYLVSA